MLNCVHNLPNKAIDTLVPLWRKGKSLQAAINAEASCLNDDDTDMILFSDLLSLFKRYRYIYAQRRLHTQLLMIFSYV